MEKIKYEIKVFDNFIEITPLDGVKDNSIYEIRLKDLKEENGSNILESETIKFCTKMTPAYTTLESVVSLVENCDIPDDIILYQIREASRLADYITTCSNMTGARKPYLDQELITFQKQQFSKYKAAYDCLLRFYMDLAANTGIKGTLGEISFENSSKLPNISDLLKHLKAEYENWQKAIEGHLDIRAGVTSGVKSSNSTSYRASTDASRSPEYSRRGYI